MNKIDWSKISAGTIARTIILIIALVNQGLTLFGLSPLPIEDEMIADLISLIFTIVTSLIAWWKNNSVTRAAIEADAIKDKIKSVSSETEE